MEKQLTPDESLRMIQAVINQTRQKYEENGLSILVWGLLVSIAGITQFALIQAGQGEQSYLAWLLTMVPGFIIMFIYKFKEGSRRTKPNKSADKSGLIWLAAGSMAMLTGFIFSDKFGIGFTAMIFAPFCIAGLATALRLRENLFVLMCVISIVMCYSSLFVEFQYHPLVAAAIATCLMTIPGAKLLADYKKRSNV